PGSRAAHADRRATVAHAVDAPGRARSRRPPLGAIVPWGAGVMTTDGSSAEARFAGAPDQTISPDLVQALERVAREPELLVVSDYDGTIAPIVRDPSQARPWPGAIRALGRIAELPRTHAAMISGRSRADLAALSGAPDS